MAITKATGGVIKDGEITGAKLALGAAASTDNVSLLGFKVATADSLAIFNMKDGIIDDYNDATGVDAAASTQIVRDANNYYRGGTAGTVTGGTITTHGAYTVHTFTSSGDFITNVAGTADVLLVGGGGSSGGAHAQNGVGGGGGGGGVRALAAQSVSAATHAVVVGAGGAGPGQYGNNGAASTIVLGSTLSAAGGGHGGYGTNDTGDSRVGGNGGSGGGGGRGQSAKAGGTGNTPSTSPAQGFAGGSAGGASTGAGGGGGASEIGATSTTANTGSAGGAGVANDWRTGSNVTYGGGGGGAGWSNSPQANRGVGGAGGGGPSGYHGDEVGQDGTANTGGGGGGATGGTGTHRGSSSGGSGIVVIRYGGAGFTTVNDMTLVSNAQTAQSTPTNTRMCMLMDPSVGTTTINTDVKAYVSRDNGTTYLQATLADEGTYSGTQKILAATVDVSGQPSGTSMRYKIETLNQSAGVKETRIYGTSLSWL